MNAQRIDFGTLPALPAGFHWTLHAGLARVRTPAGLVIGGALRAPPAAMTADAEEIQRVLIDGPRPLPAQLLDWWDRNMMRAFGVMMAAGVVVGLVRRAFS